LKYLYFLADAHARAVAPSLDPEFRLEVWRPTLLRPLRLELLAVPFLAWSLFHFLGIFANRDYFLLLIFQGARLVHRTCVFPGHFRFPFMALRDLQTGGIWTHPLLRGRSLALIGLHEALKLARAPGRRIWYLVREENASSIRLAEKAGLHLHGQGERRNRLGLRALGYFDVDEVLTASRPVPGRMLPDPSPGAAHAQEPPGSIQ
jgi:RimJ/RimL family protein N-acetyltransferase